jgi:hypothetical protein
MAAAEGFLEVKNPELGLRSEDPDKHIVSRLMRVYLLTDAQGTVVQSSDPMLNREDTRRIARGAGPAHLKIRNRRASSI